MTDEPSYFVVLKQSDHFDLQGLADVLSRSLGMIRLDVTTQLKRSWGLLHKTPELERAKELQQEFEREGIQTFVLPASELKAVPQPKVLKKGVPEQEGLGYEEEGQNKLLPWHGVVLLCAGEIEETMRVTETLPPDGEAKKWLMRTGLSVTTAVAISYERSKKREVNKQEASSTHYLDLVAKGDFESVRILGDSFDYSYLGNRMGYNALLNFKSLVLDVGKFLPDVTKNRGMRAMESGAVVQNMRYGGFDDFENEKLWLMQINRDSGD
jgi:hypothetical protein